jgi:serine/threonine protein kinase
MSNAYYDNLPEEQLTIRSRILKIPDLKLIEKIGDGGMATVWKAWDIANQRVVAVKILNR